MEPEKETWTCQSCGYEGKGSEFTEDGCPKCGNWKEIKMMGKILFAIGGFIVGTLFGWQLLEKLAKFLLEKFATLGT